MSQFVYPQVKRSLGKAALRDSYPAWFLDPDGVITAANLMAFWLCDTLSAGDLPQPDTLLGVNALIVLADNVKRIPVGENIELFTKSSALVKHAAAGKDSSVYAPFVDMMMSHSGLKYIYEHSLPHPEHEWEYPLKIVPPGADPAGNMDVLLEFQVTHYRLEGDSGFLVTYTPSPASLPVVEKEYSDLIERYGAYHYVVPDDMEQTYEEASPLAQHFKYYDRAYYPTLMQDTLWYITADNKAHQLLTGSSVAGIHFFRMFFSPLLQPWMGPIQETSGPRAVRYFEHFTKSFQRDNHELHAQYQQLIEQLKEVPEYQRVLEISRRITINLNIEEQPGMPFYTCRVILPWQPWPDVLLHFRSMVQFVYNGLIIHTDQPRYQVTLVPEDTRTEVALIALHLASTSPMPGDDASDKLRHLLWLLALLKTVQEGLSNSEDKALTWDPEAAFEHIHHEQYINMLNNISYPLQEDIAKMAIRNIVHALEHEYELDREFLLNLRQGFMVVNKHASGIKELFTK